MSSPLSTPWRSNFVPAALLTSLLVLGASAQAQPLSEGPRSPGSVVSDASFGTSAWTNPGNAASSNDTYAVSAPGNTPTQYLKATNFGFSIPATAEIVGIEVRVERRSSAGTIVDAQARIVKGGVVGATDRSDLDPWPVSPDEIVIYGGSSDLWGETWTPADINGSGFGFAISATDNVDTAAVDHIDITVYFDPCSASPAGGCRTALKSIFIVKDKTPDAKDKLIWKWIKGQPTTQGEFADPLTTATYALCIYSGTAEALIGSAQVPPDNLKWKAISTKGFKYKDKPGTEDGTTKIVLKGSPSPNKSKALWKGKGIALPELPPAMDVTLDLDLPVTVNLVNSDGDLCWGASYDTGDIKKNVPGQFKAKAQ